VSFAYAGEATRLARMNRIRGNLCMFGLPAPKRFRTELLPALYTKIPFAAEQEA
jgi:hypothetical protein